MRIVEEKTIDDFSVGDRVEIISNSHAGDANENHYCKGQQGKVTGYDENQKKVLVGLNDERCKRVPPEHLKKIEKE